VAGEIVLFGRDPDMGSSASRWNVSEIGKWPVVPGHLNARPSEQLPFTYTRGDSRRWLAGAGLSSTIDKLAHGGLRVNRINFNDLKLYIYLDFGHFRQWTFLG
jgi:hypothetical protein